MLEAGLKGNAGFLTTGLGPGVAGCDAAGTPATSAPTNRAVVAAEIALWEGTAGPLSTL
jgi:hypothetical protein